MSIPMKTMPPRVPFDYTHDSNALVWIFSVAEKKADLEFIPAIFCIIFAQ